MVGHRAVDEHTAQPDEHVGLVRAFVGRPPSGREDAEILAFLAVQDADVRQPFEQLLAQVLAQSGQDALWLLALLPSFSEPDTDAPSPEHGACAARTS